jgi:hypothetical protein
MKTTYKSWFLDKEDVIHSTDAFNKQSTIQINQAENRHNQESWKLGDRGNEKCIIDYEGTDKVNDFLEIII